MFFKFFSLGILSEMYKLYSSKKSTFCFSFTCDLFHTEAVARGCSVKKVFLEILQNSQESTCARVPFFDKIAGQACNFIKKEILAQVFSCEFCEISKKTFSYRTPPVAVFVHKSKCRKWKFSISPTYLEVMTERLL